MSTTRAALLTSPKLAARREQGVEVKDEEEEEEERERC
jgi:hypothetical protein